MTGLGPSGDPESSPSTPSGVCWSFSTHVPGSTPVWGLERAGPPALPSAQRRGVMGLPGVRRWGFGAQDALADLEAVLLCRAGPQTAGDHH